MGGLWLRLDSYIEESGIYFNDPYSIKRMITIGGVSSQLEEIPLTSFLHVQAILQAHVFRLPIDWLRI